MARRTELGVDITARDDASKVIDGVAGKAAELESTDATVTVDADDTASTVLDDVRADVAELDGETARLQVEARADAARAELGAARRELRELDGEAARVRVEAIGAAAARGDVDEVLRLVAELDGKRATARVDVAADTTEADGGLAGLAGRFGFSRGAAVAGAGAAAGLGAQWAIGVTLDASEAALQAQTLADLFGSTVEDASRLQTVMQRAGVDTGDLADIVLQMEGALRSTPELAEQLGINLADGKDSVGRFVEVVGALATEFDNAGERSQAAALLFGEEGVRQVGAVTTRVGDLETAMGAVADIRVISPDDVERARELTTETQRLRDEWEQLKRKVAELVAGPLESALYGLNVLTGGPSRLDQWQQLADYLTGIAGTVQLTAAELQTIAATRYGITLDTAAAETIVSNMNKSIDNATRPRTVPVTFQAPTTFGRLPWESSYPSGPLGRSADTSSTTIVNLPRGWRDYGAGTTATRIASRSGVIASRRR